MTRLVGGEHAHQREGGSDDGEGLPDEGGDEPPSQPRLEVGEVVGELADRHVVRHRSRSGEEAYQREDGSDDSEGLGDQQAGEASNHPVEAGLDERRRDPEAELAFGVLRLAPAPAVPAGVVLLSDDAVRLGRRLPPMVLGALTIRLIRADSGE